MEIRGLTPYIPPSTTSTQNNESAVDRQLKILIQQYLDDMNHTLFPTQILQIIGKIESFVVANASTIFQECKNNGYSQNSKDWSEHYKTFFNAIISLSKQMAEFHQEHPYEPLPTGEVDMFNEAVTQLGFLMMHKNPT